MTGGSRAGGGWRPFARGSQDSSGPEAGFWFWHVQVQHLLTCVRQKGEKGAEGGGGPRQLWASDKAIVADAGTSVAVVAGPSPGGAVVDAVPAVSAVSAAVDPVPPAVVSIPVVGSRAVSGQSLSFLFAPSVPAVRSLCVALPVPIPVPSVASVAPSVAETVVAPVLAAVSVALVASLPPVVAVAVVSVSVVLAAPVAPVVPVALVSAVAAAAGSAAVAVAAADERGESCFLQIDEHGVGYRASLAEYSS